MLNNSDIGLSFFLLKKSIKPNIALCIRLFIDRTFILNYFGTKLPDYLQ